MAGRFNTRVIILFQFVISGLLYLGIDGSLGGSSLCIGIVLDIGKDGLSGVVVGGLLLDIGMPNYNI